MNYQMRAQAGLDILAKVFPAAFALLTPLPLKCGIFSDIQAHDPELERAGLVGPALGRYVNQSRYLVATARSGAGRIDLFGNVVELVSPEHRKHAYRRLAKAAARRQQRRAREEGAITEPTATSTAPCAADGAARATPDPSAAGGGASGEATHH